MSAIVADYIAGHLKSPFKWGEHDCVTFAIRWVEIASGKSYLANYKPWTNEIEAIRRVKRLGGLEKVFDKNLKRIPANFAKDGDVAVVDGTAYLFSGVHIVGPGMDGLIFKNRMEATCAWSY